MPSRSQGFSIASLGSRRLMSGGIRATGRTQAWLRRFGAAMRIQAAVRGRRARSRYVGVQRRARVAPRIYSF